MRKKLWVAALTTASACLAQPAEGVIRHPDGDGVFLSTPNPLVIGLWDDNASAVAIGPNHAITTRHQDGGLNSTITFGGNEPIEYDVAEMTNIRNADLRVIRLEFAGGPADLTEWVDIFDGDDLLQQEFVFGGYGRSRGDTLTYLDEPYGYEWGSGPAAQPGWGANRIEGADFGMVGDYTSHFLNADFDRHDASSAVSGEAILSEFDSGGGWFVMEGGDWQVRALSANVDHVLANDDEPLAQALFGAHNDPLTDVPDMLYGIRLASYRDEIYAAIPEPSSTLLLGVAATSLLLHRRRNRT